MSDDEWAARGKVCANAGDSRAVLCRAGRAIALSEDHKPDDPKERSRIYAAGGHVLLGLCARPLRFGRHGHKLCRERFGCV